MESNYKKWINRFNAKQDVLTDDNVGEFMDVELATKLTPTSGDTVLGRDSLTGKAVEIPTNQLGGNVDTSNLVPYNGANKDVNIASNYFKTSKGFDFTKDDNNFFDVSYYYYNSLEFKSKDESEDNFGIIELSVTPETGFVIRKRDNNGLDLNLFQINNNETHSKKPFVSDVGFKTTTGTSSQYLMADGSINSKTYSETTHTHTFASITSKPTTISGYGITDGIISDDTIQNTNSFGGKRLYINTIDNVLAGADKKYWVTVTKHKKIYNSNNYPKAINSGDITLPQWEDSPVIATYGGSELFNNNYEDNITCESDEYLKVALDFSADKTSYFNGFPYGTYYLSYYYSSTPDKAEVRCYNGFPAHTIGYKTGTFTNFINNNSSGAYIQQYTDDSNYKRRNIEFIIYGHPSHPTSLTQIEWKLQRPEFNKHSSFVSNFITNKLYQILKLGDQTTDKIILNPNGTITADTVGIGILPLSEKLEVGGYAKATGFKIDGGTANKALTANGNTFDLTTKADLVGGKIPASQLPSYVDDVLEFANLASFPAIGESGKIYIAIDTNVTYRWTGTGYAEISASLALGETSSTAYRGDRGKIAYDHSGLTGNAHNTKVEELTDVSGDATSIADTDIILKKEVVGGLWKKITFANFKNWFTNELAKKINIGVDTFFNFKNISAMTLTQFKALTPNLETIYFTEEQNATGWQQIKYNGLGISIPATTETKVSITNENYIELDSDSTFNLIDVANTKINGIFEKDFVIIKFNAGVVTPTTANQWFKVILKVNNIQIAVSPVFYLTESSGTVEQIAHNFSLNVPAEMVTNGATLHLKTSATMTFNNPAISVVRVHKSSNANL